MWCVLSESGGPKVVCGLASAVKPSARLLSPSSLWLLWPPHHFLRNSASAHCFFISCSLCSGGDHIVLCAFAATPSLSSQLWPKSPHHTPARRWQERSDRKGLLDKTEASWVPLNSSHMLETCSSASLKERPDASCIFRRFQRLEFYLHTSGCWTVHINSDLCASCDQGGNSYLVQSLCRKVPLIAMRATHQNYMFAVGSL